MAKSKKTKIHKKIDGQLLQMNKTFSNLKMKRRHQCVVIRYLLLSTQQLHAVGSASESGINAARQGIESGAAGLSCRCNYDMDSKRNGEAGT